MENTHYYSPDTSTLPLDSSESLTPRERYSWNNSIHPIRCEFSPHIQNEKGCEKYYTVEEKKEKRKIRVSPISFSNFFSLSSSFDAREREILTLVNNFTSRRAHNQNSVDTRFNNIWTIFFFFEALISFFCWCCSQSVDFIDGEIRRGEGIVDADSVDTINWLVTRIYGSRLEGEIVAKKTGRVIVSVRPMRDPRFFGSNWLINFA